MPLVMGEVDSEIEIVRSIPLVMRSEHRRDAR